MKGIRLFGTLAAAAIGGFPWCNSEAAGSSSVPAAEVSQCEGLTPAATADRAKACSTLIAISLLSPDDASIAYYFRGALEIDLKDLSTAISDFTKAISLNPKLWPAHWLRAGLYGARRDYDGAAVDWSNVIEQKPTIAALYSNRGSLMDYLGHIDQAVADFSKAIELDDAASTALSYEDRASAYEGVYDWEKALADYDEAIRRNGHLYSAYRGRARVEWASGNVKAAINDFVTANDAEPADAYGILWLFVAEARSGAGASALPQLRKRAEKVDLAKWPGPIIQTLLGDRRADQVEAPPLPGEWSDADRSAGARCEISFYVGELNLARGDRAKAMAMFHAATDTGIKEYIEYRMSGYELRRATH